MQLFESWSSMGFTLLAGSIAYAALVIFLRVSGKRTLAKLNAFDLVVTMALGSTLASILTSDTLPLANGILALAVLIGMQYGVAWLGVRAEWFRRLVQSDPTVLVKDGRLLEGALRSARIGPEEVRAAVRQAGMADVSSAERVVLETDGSLSVVRGRQA